jgi:hypothetical protein
MFGSQVLARDQLSFTELTMEGEALCKPAAAIQGDVRRSIIGPQRKFLMKREVVIKHP